MDEYIERTAAIAVLCEACGNKGCLIDVTRRCPYFKKMADLPAADVKPVNEIVEAVDDAIRVLNAINSRGNETFDYGDYWDLYDAISAIYPT